MRTRPRDKFTVLKNSILGSLETDSLEEESNKGYLSQCQKLLVEKRCLDQWQKLSEEIGKEVKEGKGNILAEEVENVVDNLQIPNFSPEAILEIAHRAISRGWFELFLVALEAMIDINAKHSFWGESVLHCAVIVGEQSSSIIRELLKRGADVEIKHATRGLTALHLAVKGRKIEIIKLLLEHGADMETKSKLGLTPPPFRFTVSS